ncbi:UbiX family flavin prenyltransferase [Microvirga brassicacearum]|uniref:Flavin prenyltransferase UbiX n=1 Tax=Microvirga brassicacearum TaxID=2580413 RepID=A0A5N3PAT2_9HYPH|nr:UbiX family flavin prenyltransferase [Microvirga brassicacearum]KAB0266858.1 UbiX family flavin prenyltransferase [Microvirga brassicacearum]
MRTLSRIVIGISGASGAMLGIRIVELLATSGCETHLVVSQGAERTIAHEAGSDALRRIQDMAAYCHSIDDLGATIASGSFRTSGMIVAPCSMRTLSAIASSGADNLLVRAADVHLKERRKLVLLTRETPLHLGHIRAMAAASEIGAIIAPPVPAYYRKPQSVADIIDHTARRAIDLIGLDIGVLAEPWSGIR